LNLVLSFLARLSHTSLLPSKATLLFLTPRSPGRDCNQIAVMARAQLIPRRRGGKSKQTGGNKKGAPNKVAPDKVAPKKAAPKRGGGGGEGRPQQVRATAAWISSSLLRIEPQPDSSCDVSASPRTCAGGVCCDKEGAGLFVVPCDKKRVICSVPWAVCHAGMDGCSTFSHGTPIAALFCLFWTCCDVLLTMWLKVFSTAREG